MNEQDLLFTNEYIKTDVPTDLPPAFNNEFREYYLNQLNQNKESYVVEKINNLENQLQEEIFDDDNLLNTNSVKNIGINQKKSITLQREKKTYVSIDSRDRDIILYNKPNNFKIYLGKTFSNVKTVKLASLEFPNTNAVINATNNKIYWRNKEDIDNDVIDLKTNNYPIYEATLRTGSYILTTLQKEIISELQTIKRSFGDTKLFHYPDVHLVYDTDICTFRFLDLKLLESNPFRTNTDSNIITIVDATHTFKTGDIIYIRDAKTFADIPTSEINSSFTIISTTLTSYSIEVSTRASETRGELNGGGGTAVKIGKALDFQFLFGEYSNTVSKNLGFPQRNSSDRIDSTIDYIQQHFLVEMRTNDPHGLLNSEFVVNKFITINNVLGSTSSSNIKIIKVVDEFTLLVQTPNPQVRIPLDQTFENNTDSNKYFSLVYSNESGNSITVSKVISSIRRYSENTIYIRTHYNHGLSLSDIDSTLNLYDTLTTPSLDGENIIFTVLNKTEFMVKGSLEINGGLGDLDQIDQNSLFGRFPKRNPLHTVAFNISEFTVTEIHPITGIDSPSKTYIKIKCDPLTVNYGGGFYSKFNMDEILTINDNIQLNNIISEPVTQSIFKIITFLSSNEILIEYDQGTILDFILGDNPSVGSDYMFLLLPNHGFNKIASYTGNYPSESSFTITTILDHGLEDNGNVRIMETGNSNLDSKEEWYTGISKLNNDTFKVFTENVAIGNGNTGILGMSNDFYLYECKSFDGIDAPQNINNKKFTTTKIFPDNGDYSDVTNKNGKNMFLFKLDGVYATSATRGGGDNVFISSLKHGFNTKQDNTENGILHRSISLEGEQYVFLTCPTLNTLVSTSKVTDIFARISLTDNPGSVIFDSYLSNPKIFDDGSLPNLSELEFNVKLFDGTYYDFNDLNFSFTLEITEMVDYIENTNISSRRGVLEHLI